MTCSNILGFNQDFQSRYERILIPNYFLFILPFCFDRKVSRGIYITDASINPSSDEDVS